MKQETDTEKAVKILIDRCEKMINTYVLDNHFWVKDNFLCVKTIEKKNSAYWFIIEKNRSKILEINARTEKNSPDVLNGMHPLKDNKALELIFKSARDSNICVGMGLQAEILSKGTTLEEMFVENDLKSLELEKTHSLIARHMKK